MFKELIKEFEDRCDLIDNRSPEPVMEKASMEDVLTWLYKYRVIIAISLRITKIFVGPRADRVIDTILSFLHERK